jgi:hypothetical protein
MSATNIHLPTARRSFGSGRTPTLEDMVKDRATWGALRILITTEQIPESRIVALCCDNPEFSKWLCDRGEW